MIKIQEIRKAINIIFEEIPKLSKKMKVCDNKAKRDINIDIIPKIREAVESINNILKKNGY